MVNTSLFTKSLSMILGALSTCITMPLVFAQEDSDGSRLLEEILITAQKREQRINDVPMSIIVLSGKFMSDAGIEDTADLAGYIPGMTFSDSSNGTPVYTIRGVGFNESSPQATATIGFYYNELSVPFPIMTRGLILDIEQVEVLKGPQGTLYGRNSTGGTINYIAAAPTQQFEAEVAGAFGSFGEWYVNGLLSGGPGENVRARLAFKTLNSNGWQRSVSRGDKLGELDKLAVRLMVDIDLGEQASMALMASYWNDQSDSLAPQFLEGGYANPGPVADLIRPYEPLSGSIDKHAKKAEWTAGRTPAYDMDNTSLGMTIKADLTDTLLFASLTGYHKFRDHGSEYERSGIAGIPVSDAVRPYMNGNIADLPDGAILTNDYSTITTDIDAFAQELRLSASTDQVSWVGGVYYANTTIDNVANQSFNLSTSTNGLLGGAPFGNFPDIDNKGKQKQTTYAVFASADWHLADKITVTTGLRYSNDKISFDGCTADNGDNALATFFNILTGIVSGGTIPGNILPGGCVTWDLPPGGVIGPPGLISRELKESSWSWRLALDYDISDSTSVYGSYSRGFKSGSFPTLGASNSRQFKPVVQEQLDAFEIGFKATLANGSAQLNGAIFYYDYTDKQMLSKISDPVFGRLFALGNVDDSKISGAELDVQWLPADGWTLGAAASYINSKIGPFIGSNQIGEEIDFNGSKMPFTPDFQLTLNTKYEWPVFSGKIGFVAVDISYSGRSQADYKSKNSSTTDGQPYQYDPLFNLDSYTIINARLGMLSGDARWRSFVYVRNMTNEFYLSNVLQASDMRVRYVGKPVAYGIALQYNWQ